MKTSPFFSVVIPTYNHARFIGQCLNSVIGQTFVDWEAIVINSFSTDNTDEIVTGFQDKRIQMIHFQNEGIIAASRNEGIRWARGEYVAFLDSDDWWLSNKLELTHRHLKRNPVCDLLCHHQEVYDGSGRRRRLRSGPFTTYRELLFNHNCISTSATVVRRRCLEKLGGFLEDKRFILVEDYDLWMRLAQAGCVLNYLDEVLGAYRKHGEAASGNIQRAFENQLALLETHFASLQQNGFSFSRRRQARRLSTVHVAAGSEFFLAGQPRRGWGFYWKAIRMSPFAWKTWVKLILFFRRMI